MEIVSGSDHEDMGLDYQILEMARLNETLKKFGIADKGIRQEICSEYLFGSGYFLDAGWLKRGDKRLYPQLCFAEREQDTDGYLGEVLVLHVPSQEYALHEAAFGNAGWYFEEHNEDASEIETGSFDEADGLDG